MSDQVFDLETIKSLTFPKQKEYLKKFFIPLSDGNHIILGENGTYEIIDQSTIKKVYFSRLNAELNKFYFNEYDEISKLVCELNKPRRFNKKFNVCPSIKAIYKPYNEFSKIEKEGVELYLKYIKDVLANENEESYIYILKWLSNMLKGNKNDACIYLKGDQGIGKSTLTDFLKDHVLGKELLVETGSAPLKSQFNKILMGKLCVIFEELENFGVSEWSSISSVLKRYITSTTINIEAKGKDAIQVDNINNYILNSNNDAIRDDDGRRYFIADVSHKYIQDKNGYFSYLHEISFNDNVGSAFYSYMLDYNTVGFKPQQYPYTKSKLNSIYKKLDSVYRFLKDDYILKNSNIFQKPKDLYKEYVKYCNDRPNIKLHDLIDFKQKITNLGFEPVVATKARTSYYRISIDELKLLADNRKWIHENDLDDTDNDDKSDDMIKIPQDEYNNLLKRIKELEERLEEKIEVDKYEDDIFEENIDSILNSIENSYLDSIITEEAAEYELEDEPNEDIKEKVDDDVDEDYERGCNEAYDLINTL